MKPKVLRAMTWIAPGGGVDEQVKLSILGLQDEFEFHLLTGAVIQNDQFFNIPGLRVHVCRWLVPSFNPLMDLFSIIAIRYFLIKNKFDLIHTHETKASLLTRLAKPRNLTTPLIYGVHGVVFNDPRSKITNHIYELIEKFTIRKADKLIAVSKDVREEYWKKSIGKEMPWEIIYSGVDTRKFNSKLDSRKLKKIRKKLGIDEEDFVFINIGRFSTSKNQRDTIVVFKHISDKYTNIKMKLLLVGDGPERRKCQELVAQLNLTNGVIFSGYTDHLEDYLAISHINLLTSLREGLPRVVVEASLMKVPTVGYRVEGLTEIIEDGYNGYIVEQFDIETMVLKIEKLLSNTRLRSRFGQRACLVVKNKWDYRVMNDGLRRIYNELIEEVTQ